MTHAAKRTFGAKSAEWAGGKGTFGAKSAESAARTSREGHRL
jgi:hypothetical protein